MEMDNIIILIIIVSVLVFATGAFSYWRSRVLNVGLKKQEAQMRHRMYELAILKELGDRIGYSLNIQNIIDIITSSLHQFIEYSAVSYMLLEPEKIIFKIHLEKSVSREFINDIKERMLKSLSALLDKDIKKMRVEEVLSGAILIEKQERLVKSFFNIPLIIAGKLRGVLTIADIKAGLYQEEEMTILYKITQQASQAVTKLQEVIAVEQRKLNAMVESMTEGIVMTDKDYKVMVVNPAAKQVIGFKGKEELTIFDFINSLKENFDIRGKLEESIKLNKVLVSGEVLINDHFFQIIVSPVKTRVGIAKGKEILGGVVIFHDITHEKELEKIKEDFASMIAHELRAPLDGIKKISEEIISQKLVKSKVTEYTQMIYKNSTELLDLVNNLLDVAKLESGKFEIFKQPGNIEEIIKYRIDFFKILAKEAGIKINSHIDKNLPDKANFDQIRITQVLNNFISNALKFTKPGGHITIQALLHKKGKDIKEEAIKVGIKWFLEEKAQDLTAQADSLIVAVTDSGIGIPQDKIPYLFSKFKQFQRADISGKKKGTGLGLVIVKNVIEMHKGVVGVEAKEGAGSTFYFTIPVTSNKPG